MSDDISKGLGGLLGVVSPREDKAEQDKARREVARRLGVSHIPDPNEIVPGESKKDSYDVVYTAPSLTFPKKEKEPDEFSNEYIKKDIMKKERQNRKAGLPDHYGMSDNDILTREIMRDEAKENLKAMGVKVSDEPDINYPVKPGSRQIAKKIKKTGLANNWSVDKSALDKKKFKYESWANSKVERLNKNYKYPVKKYDQYDKSTYPSDPNQRIALAHGTAQDEIQKHHVDRQGKKLKVEDSRKTLQYISDTSTKYDGRRKAKWLFNPITGDLEDTNDPQWVEKSEARMNQYHDKIVDPQTGRPEPKPGTDAHKEKYPERYKTGYVSKSDRIVSQLKDLKEYGKHPLIKK